MIAAGNAGYPVGRLFLGMSTEMLGGERVETAGGQTELCGGLSSVQPPLPEGIEHMADE